MKTAARLFTLTAFAACTLATEAAAQFLPGEILVPNSNDNVMRRYSAGGTLLQTYSDPGETTWIGSALTPGGDYVTTFRGPSVGVKVFDDSGLQLQSWTGPAANVNDVSVFADGTLALTLQNGTIERRTQAGALLGTTTVGGLVSGSTVGADNVLYFLIPNSALLGRMNAAGTLLGNTNIGFAGGDVVQSALDGTLWVSNLPEGKINHFTTAGVQIGTGFANGLTGGGVPFGLGIAPDGLSLYATSNVSSTMRHLDLTGASLGDITLVGDQFGHNYFSVVPAVVPEPAGALLLAGSAGGLLVRRRRT